MYSKTKKIILLAVIIAALQLLIFSGTSFAGTVAESVHNLSVSGGGTFKAAPGGEDEICIFCHTPHNAISQDPNAISLPLWNRSISGLAALTFSLYTSSTFNAGPLGENTQTQPRGMTLLCLSCHDGVSALNVLHNYGRSDPTMTGVPSEMESNYDQLGDVFNPTGLSYPGPNIGGAYSPGGENIRDLSDDHPVSFTYNTNLVSADNGGLNDPSSISPLRLFNGRLECATCHNPHDQGCILYEAGVCDSPSGTAPFLRMTNLNSDMCIKCHNK